MITLHLALTEEEPGRVSITMAMTGKEAQRCTMLEIEVLNDLKECFEKGLGVPMNSIQVYKDLPPEGPKDVPRSGP